MLRGCAAFVIVVMLCAWSAPLATAQTKRAPTHDQTLQERLALTWPIKSVRTSPKKILRIVAGDRNVPDGMYHTMLVVICHQFDRTKAPLPSAIEIVNSFERVGWVYETPENCAVVLKTPPGKLALQIAKDTHLF